MTLTQKGNKIDTIPHFKIRIMTYYKKLDQDALRVGYNLSMPQQQMPQMPQQQMPDYSQANE